MRIRHNRRGREERGRQGRTTRPHDRVREWESERHRVNYQRRKRKRQKTKKQNHGREWCKTRCSKLHNTESTASLPHSHRTTLKYTYIIHLDRVVFVQTSTIPVNVPYSFLVIHEVTQIFATKATNQDKYQFFYYFDTVRKCSHF